MDRIYDALSDKLDLDLDDEVQCELGLLLSIVQQAQAKGLDKVVAEAQVAMQGLLRTKPKLHFARTVRYRLEMELLRNNGLCTRYIVSWSNGNPVMIVGMGVVATFIGFLPLYLLSQASMGAERIAGLLLLPDVDALTVIFAAFLGGVVSILSRMREFSRLRDFDPIFLFSNGFLKPYIGIFFGLFAFALLKAGFVPAVEIGGLDERIVHAWWVVGFLSGFSERFTRDIISKSETMLGGARPA